MRNFFYILAFNFFAFHTLVGQGMGNGVERLKEEDDLWYADSSFLKKPTDLSEVFQTEKVSQTPSREKFEEVSKIFGYIMLAAVLAALLYAVYGFLKTQRPPKAKTQETVDYAENDIETEEELQNLDLNKEIRKAEVSQDYRLAIRYHFLLVLKALVNAGQLRFEKNKTNQQYLYDLEEGKKKDAFAACVRYYNFVWFGEHPINEERYLKLLVHYKELIKNA